MAVSIKTNNDTGARVGVGTMLVRKTFMMGGTGFRGLLATYRLNEMHRHKVDVGRNRDDAVVRALETHQYDPADLMTARCHI